MRISDWSSDVCSSDLVGLARETLHEEVPDLAQRADHVVIDGPPRVTALARSAILAADLVLVPVQPSPFDVWASSEIVALVNEARLFKPWLRAEIGRASCRESVCSVSVELGGGRFIKKKKIGH